jgi:hypothetical protein
MTARQLVIVFRIAIVALGLCYVLTFRNTFNADGISYLDLADAFRRGQWSSLIHSHWGSLYPCILGVVFALCRPSAYWEFTAVHLTNFALYLCALASFEFLMRQLKQWRVSRSASWAREGAVSLSEAMWTALGYLLFLYGAILMITVLAVTPDLCIATLVFLAAGLVVRIRNGRDGYPSFLLLGGVLGLGYLAKAPMVFIGFSFWVVGLLSARSIRAALPQAACGLALFLTVVVLYIASLYSLKSRITFGDTARLSYAWGVMDAYSFPAGTSPKADFGVPAHPYPVLVERPRIYDFRNTVRGTYPVWYDPPYWYEGLRVRFDRRGWFQVIVFNSKAYLQMARMQAAFILGIVLLFGMKNRSSCQKKAILSQYAFLVPALLAFSMYGLSVALSRYVGAFFVLFWLGLFSAVRLPVGSGMRRWVRVVVWSMLSLQTIYLGRVILSYYTIARRDQVELGNTSEAPPHWQVASALRQAGVHEGDSVASFYDTYVGYWARLARVRILADAQDPEQFWTAKTSVQSAVLSSLRGAGFAAVVGHRDSSWIPSEGWRRVGHTGYWIYLLR